MGAVASFVSDVVDSVGDVFEAVGDVVEDVGDFVGDVVDTVGDVVQAVIDDPLPVLLSVAGSFVGIPPMVTMGALTAARGGDLEDIALSMGTAYIGSAAGAGFTNSISSTFSSTFIEAGANETFAQIAGDSITKGLINGTIAEVRGGSFEDGFAGGAVGGLVAGGIGEVGDYVKPDIIDLAMESGLDLREATSVYNAGTRAFSAGVASEITGKGDFATSFTNSAIGSSIDAGARSLNSTIDEQFASAAYEWNKEDPDGETIDTTAVGAGIPNELVGQVTVTGYGVDNGSDDLDTASVLDDYYQDDSSGQTATSGISTMPEVDLADAPQGETTYDFADLLGEETPESDNTLFAGVTDGADVPDNVVDIAENFTGEEPQGTVTVESAEPKGALATMSEAPVTDLDTTAPAVVSEAPVGENLLTAGLAQDKPEGGLNAVSPTATPQDKMASSMGIKPTDFTKPLVATVGSLLKKSLTQPKRPPPRAPVRRTVQRPAGGLQMAGAKPAQPKAPPPQRMDVASLIPIQKATPIQKAAPTNRVAPAKTLAGNTKLSPITDIATLTSLVKNKG
jgi:hypothetical protein